MYSKNLLATSFCLFLALVTATTCGAQDVDLLPKGHSTGNELSRQETSTKRKPDPEAAKVIRQLATTAAGITDADFRKLVSGGGSPDPTLLTNQPLSLVVMTDVSLPEGGYEDRRAEFQFSSPTPDPNKLVESLKPWLMVRCWTALHARYITDVTCETDDNTAVGVISFDSGQYAGQVHYAANKLKKNWQINEFSFPVRDWRFIRTEDGSWQWFDHFGRIEKDRELPKQDIVGQVLIDDKLIGASVYLRMTKYPEFRFDARQAQGESFKVSLPHGKYTVRVDSKELQNEKSGRLIVDVEEGQSELVLRIKSTSN